LLLRKILGFVHGFEFLWDAASTKRWGSINKQGGNAHSMMKFGSLRCEHHALSNFGPNPTGGMETSIGHSFID